MDKPAPPKKARQKRNRIITACASCRSCKAGCDRTKPVCSRCKTRGDDCIYLDPPHSALINGVSQDISSLSTDVKNCVTQLYSQCLGDFKEDEASDYGALESTPFVAESASFDDDVDETPTSDFGIRIGKMYLSDRLGGQFRPYLAQELQMLLQTTSHQREWAEEQSKWPTPSHLSDTALLSSDQSFLEPSANYMVPNLNLLSVEQDVDLPRYLPPQDVASRLLETYWYSVHPLVRVLHRPSFEKRWTIFTNQISLGIQPVRSLQALVFTVLFSGAAALSSDTHNEHQNQDQLSWLQTLKTGTELALTQAQVFQTTKIETIQAFVAYLLVLCREEVTKIHSSLVAAAIRIAEFNGIHNDGEERGYQAIETHIRRLIWHNLCFLDMRTSLRKRLHFDYQEAQGPWPIIDTANYTTKLPDNLDDSDIVNNVTSNRPGEQWTEMTLPLMRFKCTEFNRGLWTLRRKLIRKEATVTTATSSIENFRSEWSVKFAPDNPNDPVQTYGACYFDMVTSRAYAAILQNYHIHSRLKMPDRLLSILIQHGIKNMDKVIELETSQEYKRFRWYSGAFHQHHFALLMAVEIIMNPRRKDSARIWRGLNYVFEPPNLPPVARARWIITQAWGRMLIYVGKRSLKAPKNLEEKMQEALRLSDAGLQRSGRELSATPDETLKVSRDALQPLDRRNSPFSTSLGQSSPSSYQSSMNSPEPGKDFDENSKIQAAQPEKQLVNVDWSVLDNYFPPDEFSANLDLDFETWSTLLNEAPAPTASIGTPKTPLFADQSLLYDPLSLPHLTPASSQDWTKSLDHMASPIHQSAQTSQGVDGKHEQARQQNEQLNFGMGVYSFPH